MKGFSEPDSEWLDAATPQVAPETVLLVLQAICSRKWEPGYLDFTQAFHSGDEISRLLYAELPPEGLPGVQSRQLPRLKKTLLRTVRWALSMVQTSSTNSSEPGI